MKRRLNIKVIIGLLLMATGVILAVLALRMDRFDYSQAAELSETQAGKPAFCRLETLEKPFAHSETMQYHLGYAGEKTYVIALTPQDQESLNQKEHTVSNDGLLMIFAERQQLFGCCQPVSDQLRGMIISEYRISEDLFSQLIGPNYLAVNQPVGTEKMMTLAAGGLASFLAGLLFIVFGRKRKGKKPEEVCKKTVYLVE